MSDLKLIFEVNQHGRLVFPFSRRPVNLPTINNCHQLRHLIVLQGNNYAWWYLQMFDRIRFKTTQRELNELFDRYVIQKSKKSTIPADVIVIDSDNSTSGNDDDVDDGDDVQLLKDAVKVRNIFDIDQQLNKR
ncbi:unnamed protein product, partial [Rotaria magnacalcarata]